MPCARTVIIGVLLAAIAIAGVGADDDLPRWIVPTDSVVSPHIAWQKPSAQGPLRVLFITPRLGMREIIEVCQRFHVDRQVAAIENWNRFSSTRGGWHAVAWKLTDEKSAEDIFRKRLARDYDCIVVADVRWKILPEWVRAAILEKVGAGTGLLCRLRQRPDKALSDALKSEVTPTPQLSAFPFAGLPAFAKYDDYATFAKKKIRFATFGKGRIAVIRRITNHGDANNDDNIQPLTPECKDPFPEMYRSHYDYYLALVGHLMNWAAQREPPVRVVQEAPIVAVTRDALNTIDFTVESDAQKKVDAEFVLRDSRQGDVVASDAGTETIAAGESTISFNVADVPAGEYFADLWLKRKGKTIAFGSLFVKVTSISAIADLALQAKSFPANADVTGAVELTGIRDASTLIVQQIDNYGRVVARSELPAQNGKAPFTLSPTSTLSVVQTVEAKLISGDAVLDVKRRRFTVRRLSYPADDFMSVLCQRLVGGSYLTPALAEVCRDAGIDTWVFWPGNQDGKLLFSGGAALSNLYVAPTPYGRGTSGKNKVFVDISGNGVPTSAEHGLARNPCLTDPDYLNAARITYTEYGAHYAPVSPAFFNLGDETKFTPHNSTDDLCFSETSIKDFQAFVKEDYGTIDKLNAEYGTSHATFDEVLPVSLEATLADPALVPVWIDHRRHCDTIWARHIARACNWLKEGSPGTRAGYDGSNDTGHGPRNGALTATDYLQLSRAMDSNGLYYWPYQLDCVRDFSAPGTLIGGGWFAGYEQMWRAGHDPLAHGWWIWNATLRGANSVWIFAGLGTGHWSTIAHDFSFYDYFQNALRQTRILKQGVARLFMGATRVDDGFAVFYSPSSMLLASLEDPKDGFWNSAASVSTVLGETPFQYRMIADVQVEQGALAAGDYRVLYMPGAQCVSPEAAARILDFARSGGTVIADWRPAVADQHGKPYGKGALDALFGVNQDTARPNWIESVVKVADPALSRHVSEIASLRLDATLSTAGGKALAGAVEADAPAVIVNDFGKGRGILLNMRLEDTIWSLRDSIARFKSEDAARQVRTLLVALLATAGIGPEITMEPYVPGCRVTRFDSNGARVVSLMWDAPTFLPGAPVLEPFNPTRGAEDARKLADAAAQKRTVRLTLAGKAHIYDVLRGEYVGHDNGVKRTVTPGVPHLFSALPYKVDEVTITSDSDAVTAGNPLRFKIALATEGGQQLGKHVFRVEFTDPEGTSAKHYAANVTAPAGRAEYVLPLALNEMPGKWKLSARDVATGVSAEMSFVVHAPLSAAANPDKEQSP